MNKWEDPDYYGNSSAHHTGQTCVEVDCDEPAGTVWSPYWCFRCNVKRLKRITASMEDICARLKDKHDS